jgi:hypothetical protein
MQGILLVPRYPTSRSQSGGNSPRVRMENQYTIMRLHVFHGMTKEDVEKHWFTCEYIWYVKRIIEEA